MASSKKAAQFASKSKFKDLKASKNPKGGVSFDPKISVPTPPPKSPTVTQGWDIASNKAT
jgi:hypothetical protein